MERKKNIKKNNKTLNKVAKKFVKNSQELKSLSFYHKNVNLLIYVSFSN